MEGEIVVDVEGGAVTVRAGYVKRIREQWQKSLEAILETGRIIVEAKAALLHGEFDRMIDQELPFSRMTAFRLATISEDHRLSNVAHAQHLPPHWYTLYELTKVSDEVFESGLKTGLINPDMTRKEVEKLQLSGRTAPTFRPTQQPEMVTVRMTLEELEVLQSVYNGALHAGVVDRWLQERHPDGERPDPTRLAAKFAKLLPQNQKLIANK